MNIAALERELLSVWKTWRLMIDRENSLIGEYIHLQLAENPSAQEKKPAGQDEEDEDEGLSLKIENEITVFPEFVSDEATKAICLAHLCGDNDTVFDELDTIVTRYFSLTGVSIEVDEDDPPREVSEIGLARIALRINDSVTEYDCSFGDDRDFGDLPKPLLRRLQAAARNS